LTDLSRPNGRDPREVAGSARRGDGGNIRRVHHIG